MQYFVTLTKSVFVRAKNELKARDKAIDLFDANMCESTMEVEED